MKILRIVSFIIVLIGAPLLPFSITTILFFAYVAFGGGIELLAVSVAIDAHFGVVSGNPQYLYTLITSVLLVLSTFVKPILALYAKQ